MFIELRIVTASVTAKAQAAESNGVQHRPPRNERWEPGDISTVTVNLDYVYSFEPVEMDDASAPIEAFTKMVTTDDNEHWVANSYDDVKKLLP